jgi:RNA polymerase sigma factor (sigma-70 family)
VLGERFAQTLEAARTAADWAWADLYRDLAPSVLGYLRGHGAPDADDLVGEVFLQVVRDLGSFEGGEREFRAWVFVVAHHRLLDEKRRQARRPVEVTGRVSDGALSASAQEEALQGLATDAVRRMIERLPVDQRSVLLLRVLGDLTVVEVAQVVGKTPGAVKALQRRGLQAVLKSLIQEGVTV